jgi:hypothetical protein
LFEHHEFTERSQAGAGVIDEIPAHWRFSPERVEQMIAVVRGDLGGAVQKS